MHKKILFLLSYFLFSIGGIAQAQTVQDTKRFEPIAEAIMGNIPNDGRYAIADLADNAQGLPESYLGQLRADLEAALMLASQFEITLIDKAEMENAWREAVEFNGADMTELADASGFDALINFRVRAVDTGFQITGQVIGAGGDNAGQIIASTPQFMINADWGQLDGVAVLKDADIKEVLEQIAKLERAGGLVDNPQSFAEFYHNAETYHRQGDIDLAIKSYESAMTPEITFVDPILDLASLATARYGTQGAEQYLKARMDERLTPELMNIALMAIPGGETPIGLEEIIDNKVDHPVLYAQWLWGEGQKTRKELEQGGEKDHPKTYAILNASRKVIRSYRSGDFQNHFVDKIKASEMAKIEEAQVIEEFHNVAEFTLGTIEFDPTDAGFKRESGDIEWHPEPFEGQLLKPATEDVAAYPCGLDGYEVTYTPDLALKDFDYTVGMPLQTGLDRVVFGKTCVDEIGGYDDHALNLFNDGGDRWLASAMGQLLIRDDVDKTKPIIATYSAYEQLGGDIEFPLIDSDISKDGTVIVTDGAPIKMTYIPEMYDLQPHTNYWFFAPGIIQSSLGFGTIAKISYTTIHGEQKVVDSFISHEDPRSSIAVSMHFPMRGPEVFRKKAEEKYGNWGLEDDAEGEVRDASYGENSRRSRVVPLTGCVLNGNDTRITNVNEYVNVRSDPGFNAAIIARAALNERVMATQRTPWIYGNDEQLQYCKKVCNAEARDGLQGYMMPGLEYCLANNHLWFPVQTMVGVGYISGKFIGQETN